MSRFFVLTAFLSVVCAGLVHRGLVPTFEYEGRIVGGKKTVIDKFPYQISMRMFGAHRCGGAIINPLTIVSAAHCVHQIIPALLVIRAGTTYQRRKGVDRNVLKIVWHQEYNPNSIDNDIALLRLNISLDYTNRIQPIRLAESNEIVLPGTFANVSGWGATSESSDAVNRLQYAEVAIADITRCEKAYDLLGELNITSNMICAGYDEGGKDSCQGDSGGPLAIKAANGEPKLVGIVSFGFGCGRAFFPGVYAKVSVYRQWIDENIAQRLY